MAMDLHRRRTRHDEAGISLIEMMMTTLIVTIMSAIALPAGKAAIQSMDLATTVRHVEREL